MKNRLTHVGVQLGQDLSDPVDVATENFGHQELLFEGEHHDRHLILHVETSTGQSEGAGGQTLDRGQIKTLGGLESRQRSPCSRGRSCCCRL
jgi:hypothetical protein